MTLSVRNTLKWAWHSPTVTTWASLGARTLNLAVILPFALRRFTIEEINVWNILVIFLSFQFLIDMGFGISFVRLLAYAVGTQKGTNLEPDWERVGQIVGTMGAVYTRLAIGACLVLGPIGYFGLRKPVSALDDPVKGWIALLLVLASITLFIAGNRFAALLQGFNRIALVRRWEALTALTVALGSILVVLLGGGLVGLMSASLFGAAAGVFRNHWLARRQLADCPPDYLTSTLHKETLLEVWSKTWRTGVGMLMGFGLLRGSVLVYGAIANPVASAQYAVGLRLFQMLTEFSNAPFYSKIPSLAAMFAANDRGGFVNSANRGIRNSLGVYSVGLVFLLLGGPPFFELIGSNLPFPTAPLMPLLGFTFLVERWGAVHIQWYSTSNNIVWHIANGITGILFVAGALVLFPLREDLAFALALLFAYLTFYGWYSWNLPMVHFGLSRWRSIRNGLLGPLGIVLLAIGISLWIHPVVLTESPSNTVSKVDPAESRESIADDGKNPSAANRP